MTLLFLTPRYPWPLIGGDRIKSYYLLRHLATTHRVILVSFSHRNAATDEQLNAIRALGVEVHSVQLHPLQSAVASVRTFWTREPIEIAFYTRPEFKRVVDSILATTHVDVGIAFFMRTAEYIRQNRSMRKILIAEDCRVEYQTRSMRASKSFPQRLIRWWEILKLRKYESDVIDDFDAVTYVSAEDVAAMRRMKASSKYTIVTNGVDLERFSFNADHSNRSGVLFMGKLDVHANELMVNTIVEQIMPLVRKVIPKAVATIVGASRTSKGRVDTEGVHYTGAVPDGVPYMHDAAVFLHPHAGASGIQNKLLEAMAAGCAVVTTNSGLQGIEGVHGIHCLVFSNPTEAAEHVIRLLNNPDERATLAANARKLMEDTHSWDLVNRQIDSVIHEINNADGSAVHATNNDVEVRPLRAGLLLDRDGIINERIDDGYVRTPDEFDLLPDIAPIIRFAQEQGMPVAVITNQQGVGKGLMSAQDLTSVHDSMHDVMKSQHLAPLDGVYVCTSLHEENDERRKPNPGMLLEAIGDLRLDPAATWMIGDSVSDAEAGRRAGVRTMLVGPFPPHAADVVVPDLKVALEILKKN